MKRKVKKIAGIARHRRHRRVIGVQSSLYSGVRRLPTTVASYEAHAFPPQSPMAAMTAMTCDPGDLCKPL